MRIALFVRAARTAPEAEISDLKFFSLRFSRNRKIHREVLRAACTRRAAPP